MKYRFLMFASCVAHAHLDKATYTIHLEIDNSTPEDIHFDYRTEQSYLAQPVVCKANSQCTLKWLRKKPFKVQFSHIKCGDDFCYHKSVPVKYHTLYSIPKHNQYNLKKIRVYQSWPFRENTISTAEY